MTAQASTPAATGSGDLGAPLYIAWQVTNECNLACLHCIEESGPGKAFPDELSDQQVFAVLQQAMDLDVPYLSFSGGEPMVHPRFFDMVEYVCSRNGQLKIETNGHYLSRENCERFKALGVKAVQVSLDGATSATFNKMRVRGNFNVALEGVKNLHAAGVPIEVNYSPTHFNCHEIGIAVDLAAELGAYSFYTGRTMYTGNAVKAWRHIGPSEEQYAEFFATLHRKTEEYRGRMRVHFHEMGLLEELRYRLQHPAALLIVLPNGLVKLINALPFICGDLRRQSLGEVWAHFQEAWQDPRVAQFVDDLAQDPRKTSTLHQWVHLSIAPPHQHAAAAGSPLRSLLLVLSFVRYRFFLYAGLLPYVLGAAWAYAMAGTFDAAVFWSGLGGIVLAVVGVESFNEYFDDRMGTDRVFNPADVAPMSVWVLWLGVAAFAFAFAVGIYLTLRAGWPVLAFAVLGGFAAIFYVAPPIRWAYRGLGETVIALSYGPWMVLGSLYLHTRELSWGAFWASLVPGLLIMALAVVNAIPDFHQDRLVGKRNLVVRLGRRRGVWLYLLLAGAGLATVAAGVAAGQFPAGCLLALLALPLLVASARAAFRSYESPRQFVPAIRAIVACYALAVALFTVGIVLR